MKRTLANIKKLIEAKIIQYRKLQDEQQSAGNYERAEKYKIRRWELEELLEDLESEKSFKVAYRFYNVEEY